MFQNGEDEYEREYHDEIHDALHREAKVDYTKPIIRNASPSLLYEHALNYERGTALSSSGAIVTESGAKKGRSPKDKRVVCDAMTKDDVWWGPVNIAMTEASFMVNHERAVDYLNTRDRLYVFDGFAGWDPRYRIKVRVVCARAYHALFMHNMLIRPTAKELAEFGEPDFTIFNAGDFPANRYTTGMTSSTSVALNFTRNELVILGTAYAGEMKKGIFTVMHYLMPKAGVLSLHSSCNEGPNGDTTLFFGLSGTGKTTLSADPHRALIGDDEHCWSDEGVFNIEGGCYAKAIDLSPEKEPEIFGAIRFGSVLENVVLDAKTRVVDYADDSLTENTRCAYPIEYMPSAKMPCVGKHPTNIVLLTCDAFGVLPPVSLLTSEQAMYHFISGYTAKVAGTEEGVTEPTATFSACFGAPFLVFHPTVYAKMLGAKLAKHAVKVWLVNTGWTGGAYGVGSRMKLAISRGIIDAIHNGKLYECMQKPGGAQNFPIFNLQIPTNTGDAVCMPSIDPAVLDPQKAWASSEQFAKTTRDLAGRFRQNFETFRVSETDNSGKGVTLDEYNAMLKAGPQLP